jgi:hypothetical protein
MKLFVIGVTGQTGREIVEQALARGHRVTAFVRSPEGIKFKNERLAVIEGNAMDENELINATQNHDAVLQHWGRACFSNRVQCSTTARCNDARNAGFWGDAARRSLGCGAFFRYSQSDRQFYHTKPHARLIGDGRDCEKERSRLDDRAATPLLREII